MPYQRGAGMSQTEAERIAAQVREHAPGRVQVLREGRFFVVVVEMAERTLTLRDEEDWGWLRRQSVEDV